MVTITRDTTASQLVASKARNTWIRKLSDFSYCVTPKGPWGTKRRVTLGLKGNNLTAFCENYYTGETCPACTFGNLCYSVARVIAHLEKQVKRQERQVA
jgi:hypothetical protein